MRIKKIQLKNGYKRFHDLTINLGDKPKRIIALVGPNGCGKSSVLDGLLYITNSHGQIGNTGIRDYKYHSTSQLPSFNWQNISVEFENNNYQTVRSEKQKIGKENTIFSFRSPYRYNSDLKVKRAEETTEIRHNNYGASTSSDLDTKMEQSYRRLNIKFNRYMKDNPSTATYDSTKLKIIKELNDSLGECLDLEITSIGDIEAGQGTLFFKKNDQSHEFEFNVLSSGEKEVVDILLDLYLRQEEYNDTVFLIDEPELHINTSIQKKLLIEINKLVGNNCQIWIATHSIGFLRALQEELKDECQIIQFQKEVKWATEEKILTPMKKSLSKWKELFETALDDLNGLVSPKRIIYCEGRDILGGDKKEKGLDAQVYNNIFEDQYTDTLFVSAGGCNELDTVSIKPLKILLLKKIFSDIEVLLLKDGDCENTGNNATKEKKVLLKQKTKILRILNRLEIENYLYDKEVLLKYCSENSFKFNEVEYDKLVTDIANQNLKARTEEIKIICGVNTSISKEDFKLNIAKTISSDMGVYSELKSCIFTK